MLKKVVYALTYKDEIDRGNIDNSENFIATRSNKSDRFIQMNLKEIN